MVSAVGTIVLWSVNSMWYRYGAAVPNPFGDWFYAPSMDTALVNSVALQAVACCITIVWLNGESGREAVRGLSVGRLALLWLLLLICRSAFEIMIRAADACPSDALGCAGSSSVYDEAANNAVVPIGIALAFTTWYRLRKGTKY